MKFDRTSEFLGSKLGGKAGLPISNYFYDKFHFWPEHDFGFDFNMRKNQFHPTGSCDTSF